MPMYLSFWTVWDVLGRLKRRTDFFLPNPFQIENGGVNRCVRAIDLDEVVRKPVAMKGVVVESLASLPIIIRQTEVREAGVILGGEGTMDVMFRGR
mmetsp:Transcript_18802/g.44042  ORF Transcript_18802/g.44042 Transcript_18802/m.44042 type:complete len:96 (+) Transcript_18802:1028-1315(+)